MSELNSMNDQNGMDVAIENKKPVLKFLIIFVVLQVVVLCGMVIKAQMPIWTGTEVRVKTVPYDPRSMFRGNYAYLNYDIAQLPEDALSEYPRLREGEVVYVSLNPAANGLHEFAGASLEQPEKGVFIRGRITRTYPPYRVKYGIEAFFAPKEKALKLEDDLRHGGVAILMIDGQGNVALQDVVPDVAGVEEVN